MGFRTSHETYIAGWVKPGQARFICRNCGSRWSEGDPEPPLPCVWPPVRSIPQMFAVEREAELRRRIAHAYQCAGPGLPTRIGPIVSRYDPVTSRLIVTQAMG